MYHSPGTAYRKALAGMVWWNAVSNTATCGSSGRAARIASMPVRSAGFCNGASGANDRIAAMTSSSTRTEFAEPLAPVHHPVPGADEILAG